MTNYRIVRRAFSQFTEVEIVAGWLPAQLRAMALQAERNDGEYLIRDIGEDFIRSTVASHRCPVQAAFAYL